MTVTLNRADLDFLLRQVTINYLIPDGNGGFVQSTYFNYSALANALDPSGLREVAGSNNNLVGGHWDPNTFNPLTGQNGVWVTGPNTTWGQSQQPFLNISMGQASASAPAINYNVPGSAVTDMDPRLISNLVATMFTSGAYANPAAELAATNGDPNAQFSGLQVNGTDTAFVANAGVLGGGRYNGWFVSFGQFFDHGLDFVNRDSNPAATITVNLSESDPLYSLGADNAVGGTGADADVTSISIRRADVANESDAGVDGVFGTTDDVGYSVGQDNVGGTADDIYAKPKYINQTGLLIDQSQTYGSDPSVNALIREYTTAGQPTGRVVTGHTTALTDLDLTNDADANGLATWADIKANALRIGIVLNDAEDLHNTPMLRVNAVGKLMYTPNAAETYTTAQITGYDPANQDPNDPFVRDALGNVLRTGQNMLIDFNPGQPLDSHIITGDGRGNENIGLTAVHHIFHEEHNSLVGKIQAQIIAEFNAIAVTDAAAAAAFIAPWQSSPGVWDGEKLYQAARLITESEYNHIAIDQYVGVLYGALPEFVSYSSDINMGVSLEFSQAVFRLGHSMLTETFNVTDPNTGEPLKLLDMFLNPALYQQLGPAALADGLLTTLGNEVDEFVTPALQQSLLGQPLDLATINIARGRDVNLPTWNEFRSNVYNGLIQNTNNTNGSALAPYTSWADVFDHLKNELTGVNLIAAYARGDGDATDGINPLADAIVNARAAYEAGTGDIQDLRAAAQAMYDAYLTGDTEAVQFMEGAPVYDPVTRTWNFTAGDQGYWDIDLWIGGLAERPLFDGPLGTTFSYVILDFAQRQQDGDRFYYLYRTPMGTHLGDQVIRNQFTNLVAENTGLTHIGDAFVAATAKYELGGGNDYFNEATHQIFDVDGTPMPATAGHIIIAGNDGDDYIIGGLGDDYIYGDNGNDYLFGSQGNDQLHGGAGNDYIYDDENDDFITGGDGDDVIFAGPGVLDTVMGDNGDDEIHGGDGIDELIGGYGDDRIFGDGDTDVIFGNEGNDFMDGGDSVDEMWGGEGNDWIRGGVGDDHLNGGEGNDLLEGGIGAAANDGDRLIGAGATDFGIVVPVDTGFDVGSYEDVNIAITANLDTSNQNGTGGLLDTYAGIDGLVGSRFNDNLVGASVETISANGFNNLLVGGGGDDVLTGLSGDDIIVGDSVATHSDFTVDAAYASAVANWKGTGDDRPDYDPTAAVNLGYFLGDNGLAGTADVAVFSGNALSGGYTADFITYGGYNALRITDVDASDGDDGTDILIGVETGRFADGDVSLLNGAPALDLHAFNLSNVADDFSPAGYAGNDGSVNWNGSWTETNDASGSTGGDINVTGGRLHFGDSTDGNEIITRAVNLSGAASATLSFDYQEDDRDSGEDVLVQALNVTNNTWEAVGTMLGSASNGSGSFSVNLTANQIGANSAIRFATVSGWENGENFYIDNVNIAMRTPVNDASNNYVTTFTEDSAAVAISAGPSITDDGTQMRSAKVVLTNRKPGDVLGANDIGGDGISSSVDTSDPNRITITLTGIATLAAYQAAIQAITFANTSQNPDTTDRLIDVTVNDGLFNSNVAQATVHVAAVDDVVNANNDAIVTNFGTGVAIVVPEWALIANDVDADNAIDITALSGVSGLTASLMTNPGSLTITDTGSSGGSFTYTATGGPATDTANVSVTQDAGDITSGGGSQILVGNGNSNSFSSGSGNDVILAGGGNDELDGGSGVDVLVGGAGNDTFIFDDGDTGTGASRDIIVDFLGGGGAEDIDLSAIDANTTVGGGGGGGQAFTFIGTAAFSDTTAGGQLAAGQVRYELFDSDGNGSLESTLIQANVNNNLTADYEILLKDFTGAVTTGDFVL